MDGGRGQDATPGRTGDDDMTNEIVWEVSDNHSTLVVKAVSAPEAFRCRWGFHPAVKFRPDEMVGGHRYVDAGELKYRHINPMAVVLEYDNLTLIVREELSPPAGCLVCGSNVDDEYLVRTGICLCNKCRDDE